MAGRYLPAIFKSIHILLFYKSRVIVPQKGFSQG